MKKVKEYIINFINGFCMALADSVPGVSGGTIAFILGFYDNFIGALDDLFRGNLEEKKKALVYLIKLGIGWAAGFVLAAVVLSSLFESHIYAMSSLFIGFIILAIPLVIKEEKESIKGKYKNILFLILGIALVVGISLLTKTSIDVNMANPNIGTYIYTFFAGAIAICAMVLPGISGSTLLLIFGIYIPIMNAIKTFLTFDFSVVPILCAFGFGVIFGIVTFIKILKICLKKFRSQTIYAILGMMIGSLYAIVLGPTTLDVPKEMLTFETFNILFFVIGCVVIVGLELLKKFLLKND
jgi:putative membrane protein